MIHRPAFVGIDKWSITMAQRYKARMWGKGTIPPSRAYPPNHGKSSFPQVVGGNPRLPPHPIPPSGEENLRRVPGDELAMNGGEMLGASRRVKIRPEKVHIMGSGGVAA